MFGLGEALAKDMIATRIGPRPAHGGGRLARLFQDAAESPEPRRTRPTHQCINLRLLSAGGFYAWEPEKDGREVRVRVEATRLQQRFGMIVRAATAGFGLCFVMEDQVEGTSTDGRLVRVLEDWCPSFPGYHLDHPSRRQPSAAFALLVEALRYRA